MKINIINTSILIIIICCLYIKTEVAANNKQQFIELFKPVQLIYPDSNHDKLIINESSINLLNTLLVDDDGENDGSGSSNSPISVLGVVGTFHSGKSFLLNQLLGTTDSFRVGPTVHPQTIGIWMWACKINDDNGIKHTLLLLDTEGFYSSNVSETYDAKIFAITTLLSSHLIYNSVKIIDQSALEYLELLSRRTQLFALKSQIKSNEDSSDENKKNNENLKEILNFPSLTWVVQDFFQDIGDETPTQWLNNLLKAHSRDKDIIGDSLISITEIFPSIECHTLFLPSGDRDTLRHLNKAKPTDLNPVYIRELNQLKHSLFSSGSSGGNDKIRRLKPKLSGPSISTLLRLLIEVANGNKFPSVPSIWSGFIKQQQQSALEDSILAYREKIKSSISISKYHQQYHQQNPPLNYQQFQQIESIAFNYSINLYKQLLFGLEEAYKPGENKLKIKLEELYETYLKENNVKIRNYCSRISSEQIEIFQNQLDSIKIPISSDQLNKMIENFKIQIIKDYNKFTKVYKVVDSKEQQQQQQQQQQQENHYEYYLKSLEKDIERLINGKSLQNKNEIEILLTKAGQSISERYKLSMNKLEFPVTMEQLKQENEKLEKELIDKFKKITEIANLESYYQAFEAMSEKKLKQLYQYFIEYNESKILDKAKFEFESSILDFKKSIGTLILPIEEDQLLKSINDYRLRSINSFKKRLEQFRNSNSYSSQLEKLELFLEKQIELKLNENVTQMKWIVMESLETVRVMMISRTPAFWFQHSYENEAYREAEKRIVNKIKSKPLRDKVIKQFIDNDLKVQRDSLFRISTILLTTTLILLFSILISISILKK